MIFDITNIDKVVLIQALYAHAEALGLGELEHSIRMFRNEKVSGLSIQECQNMIAQKNEFGTTPIADYYNGKPMKIVFREGPRNGKITVEATRYDTRNGKYRFLEAMLNTFSWDEIKIVRRGYPIITDTFREREEVEISCLKEVMKNVIKVNGESSTYWIIDEAKASYKPFMFYN